MTTIVEVAEVQAASQEPDPQASVWIAKEEYILTVFDRGGIPTVGSGESQRGHHEFTPPILRPYPP